MFGSANVFLFTALGTMVLPMHRYLVAMWLSVLIVLHIRTRCTFSALGE